MRTWCERSLSDDTFVYEFALEKEKTVEDVVNWILENKLGEWGNIYINNKEQSFWDHLARCEYDHQSIKEESPLNKFLKQEVDGMSANGGWGRMDFVIFVKGE